MKKYFVSISYESGNVFYAENEDDATEKALKNIDKDCEDKKRVRVRVFEIKDK